MSTPPTLPGLELTLDEEISRARTALYVANLEARDAARHAEELSRKLDTLLWKRESERAN